MAQMATIFHGVGRRKSAVARVWLRPGKGKININGRPIDVFFHTIEARFVAQESLKLASRATAFDVEVSIEGGGNNSQAGAVRLGIARALLESDATIRPVLKKHGMLRCDSRVKERKKYGQRGARRKFQFVKR